MYTKVSGCLLNNRNMGEQLSCTLFKNQNIQESWNTRNVFSFCAVVVVGTPTFSIDDDSEFSVFSSFWWKFWKWEDSWHYSSNPCQSLFFVHKSKLLGNKEACQLRQSSNRSKFTIQYSIFNIHNIHISIFTLFIIQYHKFTNPVAIKWPVHPTSWDNQNLDHVWTRVCTDHTYSLLAWLLSRVAKCNWNSMNWHFATRLLCRVEANMQPPLSPTSILQHFSTEQKSKESLHWFGKSLCHFRPLCLRRFQFWLPHLSHIIVSSFKMVPFFFVALQTCLSCSCCSDGREDGGRTHFLRSDNFHQKLPNFGLNKTKVW